MDMINTNNNPLNEPCLTLPGVGKVLAEKLHKCGLNTIQDLLFHLPFRYQDKTRITPIEFLVPNQWSVVVGKICKIKLNRSRNTSLDCYIEDKTGIISLRFFHFNKHQMQNLSFGKQIKAFGEVKEFAGNLQIVHPEYQILDENAPCTVDETLTPIYPATQGLSQTLLRKLIKIILTKHQNELETLEWMDKSTLAKHNFQPIASALNNLHNPPPDIILNELENGQHQGLRRLAFDELLAQKISMQFARQKRASLRAVQLSPDLNLTTKLLNSLPFKLTNAQMRVYQEIQQDLQKDTPMQRLVQGDVGSGKTIVCALAALQAIANNYQVAIMAPTDILSEQHAITISNWLKPLNIHVLRLSGKMKVKERREALQALKEHKCQVIIGTHALFQAEVEFAKLGLIIIDEQHRFGVEQRALLNQKGQKNGLHPHQLLMTATPIPRTLAMADFSHLDLSAIDEMPPGRVKVTTAVLPQNKEQEIITRLESAITNGRQAYWVCTLIDESEKLQCINAIKRATELQEQLPHIKIGLVHGRIKPQDKEQIMLDFKQGKIDLLVATTVIEVGVDVPNASLMIIENAERLGLSQLHQLRGRVGRGQQQSHCLLLYQAPLAIHSQERLKIMRATNNGFEIAEKDLQIRGFGELLGKQQTGYHKFKIARLDRDSDLLAKVKQVANTLIKQDLTTSKLITKRWLGENEHFIIS